MSTSIPNPGMVPEEAVDAFLDVIGYGRNYPPRVKVKEALLASLPYLVGPQILSEHPGDSQQAT